MQNAQDDAERSSVWNKYRNAEEQIRDPTCAVLGCNQVVGLEKDHREDWATTKRTSYVDSDRLCGFDHDKKTRLGWALVEGSGKRPFVPPDDPRHPRYKQRPPPQEADAA